MLFSLAIFRYGGVRYNLEVISELKVLWVHRYGEYAVQALAWYSNAKVPYGVFQLH